jgi:hypothetical protein
MDREFGVRICAPTIVLLVVAVACGCATSEPNAVTASVDFATTMPVPEAEASLRPHRWPDYRPREATPVKVAKVELTPVAPKAAPTKQASMSDFKVPNGLGEGAWDGFRAGFQPGVPLVVLPLTVAAGAAIGIVNARRLAEKRGR